MKHHIPDPSFANTLKIIRTELRRLAGIFWSIWVPDDVETLRKKIRRLKEAQ